MSENILEILNISKYFPGIKALDNVSFSVRKGTVHVLCGENGAGKSTLMKIINGIYNPDSGKIVIKGKSINIKNPLDAIKNGLAMISQELNYIPEMTIQENFYLGEWPCKMGKIQWKVLKEKVSTILKRENFPYDASTKMKYLSISEIQHLEILKAISKNAEIIIMDEPTSAITENEILFLFDKINKLRKIGTSIVYISHKMDEIFQIADDITVIRDGKVIETRYKKYFTIDTVIEMMVGREISNKFPKEQHTQIRPKLAIEVSKLCLKGVFDDVNFHGYSGEIIGFAGLLGAGRTDLMSAIFGFNKFDSGSIFLSGIRIKVKNIQQSISHKIAMITEDRRTYGIIPVRNIRENTTLSSLSSFFYNGYLHKRKEFTATKNICEKMHLNTQDYEKSIDKLSGGNQQKVILARWVLQDPDILIMDEPTRGIDVGAKYEIYKIMNELVKNGKTIIFISSELPELIGMSDRIYIMSCGRIQGELARKEFSQKKIMELAIAREVKSE